LAVSIKESGNIINPCTKRMKDEKRKEKVLISSFILSGRGRGTGQRAVTYLPTPL
jgi:hypothetical protein